MGHVVADIFRQAAQLNRDDPRRQGNVIRLADAGEMIVAGDLHGNRGNLNKIIDHASLGRSPQQCLVLQEVIHGPVDPDTGHDRSIELLVRVARLKIQYPQQVLTLLGNHDVAQIANNEITKDGRGVCKEFNAGVRFSYGDAADEISEAMNEFLLSMPLAAICPNRVLMAHSLPSPHRMEIAGMEILSRATELADLPRGKGAYEWTWGRNQTAQQLDDLAESLDVDFFVLGHKHVPEGCETIASRAMLLASDNERGCIVQFTTSEPLTIENCCDHVRRIITLGN